MNCKGSVFVLFFSCRDRALLRSVSIGARLSSASVNIMRRIATCYQAGKVGVGFEFYSPFMSAIDMFADSQIHHIQRLASLMTNLCF